MTLLKYDPSGVFFSPGGLDSDALGQLRPQLDAARDEVRADLVLFKSGDVIPAKKQPLDAAFTDLPDRLLAEHEKKGDASQISRIQTAADRLAAKTDRVVLLGIGGSYMGARALLEACCHPYYNQLDRSARKDRPRIFFEGNNVDNDALQGLLDILVRDTGFESVLDRWGISVISKSGGTIETAVAFRLLLRELERACDGDQGLLSELIVPVTGPSGRLFELARSIGCPDVFEIPDGVGGRFSVFTAVGLLPAAILGLDVVALLEGASAMNQHFDTAPVGENAVLDYVGVCHWMEETHGATTRILSTWGKGLEATGLWYDQLLAESLGKQEQGALPLTVVNTRDLHSRGQQHQEGRRDKLITNLVVGEQSRVALTIGQSERDQDKLNDLADKTLPQVLSAAIQGTNKAYAEDRRPTADLTLPRLDEYCLGQLLQMLMLATVAEGRMIGINPYGQPGVEGYKRHMNEFLREK